MRGSRAGAIGIGAWLVTGALLFTRMGHLQPRYLEAMTPAVAAMLGVGLAGVLARARLRAVAATLVLVLVLAVPATVSAGIVARGAWTPAIPGACRPRRWMH